MAGVLVNLDLDPVIRTQPIATVLYLAFIYAIQDIVWIRQLLKDIDLEGTRPTKVLIDNSSA